MPRTLWPGVQTSGVTFLQHEVTSLEVAAKSVALAVPVGAVGQIQMSVRGGLTMAIDIDYYMPDLSTISWDGMTLDGVLEAGDILHLVYSA